MSCGDLLNRVWTFPVGAVANSLNQAETPWKWDFSCPALLFLAFFDRVCGFFCGKVGARTTTQLPVWSRYALCYSQYASKKRQESAVLHCRLRQLTHTKFSTLKLLEWLGITFSERRRDFHISCGAKRKVRVFFPKLFLVSFETWYCRTYSLLTFWDNGSEPAQPSCRTPDRPRTGRLWDRPGGAF